MDKDKWAFVENSLRCGGHVRLCCDGYQVVIGMVRISMCRLALSVLWINSVFNGKWFFEDCEERRRFLHPKKSYLYSRKLRASMKKRARLLKKLGLENSYDLSTTYWSSTFPSIAALRRHFEANNTSVEIVLPSDAEKLKLASA